MPVRRVVVRVVAELDALGGQRGHGGDVGLEGGDPHAPLAGRLDADVAAEQAERVDGEVEGALEADQVDADAGLPRRVAPPKFEAGMVGADRDRQHQHAVGEADVGDPDGGPVDAQRAEAARPGGRAGPVGGRARG